MRKIAIVSYTNFYDYREEESISITHSITDWEEVTNEDYEMICSGLNLLNNQSDIHYLLLEFEPQRELIGKSIQAYKDWIKRNEERLAKKKEEDERKKALRQAKKEEKERKKLEELKQKYGNV